MRFMSMLHPLGLAVGFLVSEGCLILESEHCLNNGGDSACAAGQFCNQCLLAGNGCADEMPSESCYFPGESDESSTSGIGPTMTETGVMTTNEVTTVDPTADSTGPVPCDGDGDCPDAAMPFCGPGGECVDCSGMVDPDGACMGRDPANPLCVGGACVQCTEAAPEVCEGTTPICDDATNTCGPCTMHEGQCGEAACNLFTGACLPEDAVVHVGPGQMFADLTMAADSFGPGAQATIIVHQDNYTDSVTVDTGKTIAFLANTGDRPIWDNQGPMNPQLTASNAVVLLDNLVISGFGNSNYFPVVASGSDLWVDRSQIIDNDGGGITVAGGNLIVRNSFIQGGTASTETVGLNVAGTAARVIYSTILLESKLLIPALFCTDPSTVEIRNSIVLTSNGNDIECGAKSLTITNSAPLGNLDAGWFTDFNNGDYHLTLSGLDEFANIATWRAGDPATDIDGNLRPSVDNTSDYAGADRP